jgi:hypothetical protein
MSKVVKLKQKDLEKIVSNVISENQDLDELQLLSNDGDGEAPNKIRLVYWGLDDENNCYIIDAESGEILAKDNPANHTEEDSLPMAAE